MYECEYCGSVYDCRHQREKFVMENSSIVKDVSSPVSKLKKYISKLKELEGKATEGKWTYGTHYSLEKDCRCLSCYTDDGYQIDNKLYTMASESRDDCQFIAESRQAIPLLIKIIEKQQKCLEWYDYENVDGSGEVAEKTIEEIEGLIE